MLVGSCTGDFCADDGGTLGEKKDRDVVRFHPSSDVGPLRPTLILGPAAPLASSDFGSDGGELCPVVKTARNPTFQGVWAKKGGNYVRP